MKQNKADLIIHPIRLRILRELAHRQLSTAELQHELSDIPVASLYRHIGKLLAGGVITVCNERMVKGTVQRIFSLPNPSNLIDDKTLKKTSKEDHLKYFSTFMATLLGDFKNYLESKNVDLKKDGVGYRTMQIYLNDAELEAMAKDMQKAILPYLELKPLEGRVARIFSTILIPNKFKSRRQK